MITCYKQLRKFNNEVENIENITIRQAQMKDYELVRNFIAKKWKIGNCDAYFRYYHVVEEKLNFVIAIDERRKTIYGTCGYVLTNLDPKFKNLQLILLLIPPNKVNVSSLSLISYMLEKMNPYSLSSCGVTDQALMIYKYLKYQTGQMNHYCMLAAKKNFRIAVIHKETHREGIFSKFSMKKFLTMDEISKEFDFDLYRTANPYKDEWCIKHRYFESMYHEYEVFGIYNEQEECKSLLVFREISANGATAARVVDCVGQYTDIGNIYQPMLKILTDRGYEFIDFQNVGIDEEIMNAGGFYKLNWKENILPHLFEPFIQTNKVINYFTSNKKDFVMFIGDCDQDRANIFE